MNKDSHNAELLRLVISALLFIVLLAVSLPLVQSLHKVQTLNHHRAELSNVKYGLLNSEVWMEQLAVIIENKITQFQLTDANRAEVHRAVTKVLDQLVVEFDSRLRRQRQQGGWLDRQVGKLAQLTQDAIIDVERLRQKLPEYTDQILNELDKPSSRREIKQLLIARMQAFRESAFAPVDMTLYNGILHHHGCETAMQCDVVIQQKVVGEKQKSAVLIATALGSMALMLVLGVGRRQQIGKARMSIMLLAATLLLVMGVATPMLEVMAGISSLTVIVFEEPITFVNQTLYFQSKSILEVITLLLTSGKVDWIVALLIGLFGIVLPLLKLLASFLYHFDIRQLRGHALVEFLALKSGKWSMVDVMVIAILVAYLGFDRMIGSQLDNLVESTRQVEVFTTNGTALQWGFYLFLGYCLAGLFIASLIEKSARLQAKH